MEKGLREEILECFPQKQTDIRMYSPLALAFLGDGVYSLIVRTMVISKGNRQAEKLHNDTRKYVSAHAQARIGDAIRSSSQRRKQEFTGAGATPIPIITRRMRRWRNT